MSYLTTSKKLEFILQKGTLVNINEPIKDYTAQEIESYKKKGWQYYLFIANENENFDFLKFGQWVGDIKFFIDNVYFSII